jgi:hypothetical protein
MKAESGEGTEAGRAAGVERAAAVERAAGVVRTAAVERAVGVQRASLVTTSWPDRGKGAGDRLKKKQAGAMMTVVGARMVERMETENEKEEELKVEVEHKN